VVQVSLRERGVILATEEVSRQHTALVNLNRAHVEVELTARVRCRDQVLIDDAARGRVQNLT